MILKKWQALSVNNKILLGVISAFVVWMASGLVLPEHKLAEPMRVPLAQVNVEARPINAEAFERTMEVIGRTEADNKATISARTSGVVEHMFVQRGSVVKQGMPLLRLDVAKRNIQLAAAKAELASASKLAHSARELAKDGYIAASTLAEREAKLAAAKQALALVQQDLSYTHLVAPIDGVVEDTKVMLGDFVNVGTPLLTLVNPNGVLITADVGQTERDQLQPDALMRVKLVNGQHVTAKLNFIAGDANMGTRTFRIEGRAATVSDTENTPAQIPLGMTANISIPLGITQAYALAHAWLVLGAGGEVAAMVAKQEVSGTTTHTVARKVPVNILQDTANKVWVSGLPEQGVILITRGQAGLIDGNIVSLTMAQEGKK